MVQSTIHEANEDGQHDEMETAADCPACAADARVAAYMTVEPAPMMVRYCTPATCQDPRCSNYAGHQPAETLADRIGECTHEGYEACTAAGEHRGDLYGWPL